MLPVIWMFDKFFASKILCLEEKLPMSNPSHSQIYLIKLIRITRAVYIEYGKNW